MSKTQPRIIPSEIAIGNRRTAFIKSFKYVLPISCVLLAISLVGQSFNLTPAPFLIVAIFFSSWISSMLIFNRTLLYRNTKKGTYIERYQGQLGQIDKPNNLRTGFFISCFASIFLGIGMTWFLFSLLPSGDIFNFIIAGVTLVTTNCACLFIFDKYLNTTNILSQKEQKELAKRSKADPGMLPLSDIRNLTGTTNPASPNSFHAPDYSTHTFKHD